MSSLYKTSENMGLDFCQLHVLHSIAPVWGEYYRIGACPYLSDTTFFCPCKGRRVQHHNELCAPYRGKVCVKHKRRGKPLRYNLPSLRDLTAAEFLLDTNNFEHPTCKSVSRPLSHRQRWEQTKNFVPCMLPCNVQGTCRIIVHSETESVQRLTSSTTASTSPSTLKRTSKSS